jgi:hypothetical protein
MKMPRSSGFQKDPDLAAEYLDAILKDGDEGELLQALQRMSKAFGGVGSKISLHEQHIATLPTSGLAFTMTSVTDGFQHCRARIRSRRGMSVSRALLPAEPGAGPAAESVRRAACGQHPK